MVLSWEKISGSISSAKEISKSGTRKSRFIISKNLLNGVYGFIPF
jgi:hypothetical protein